MTDFVFLAKGVLSLVGVVLLLWHMDREWDRMQDRPQRARYMLLLAYGLLVAGASAEQAATDVVLGVRHWVSLVLSLALVGVASHSIAHSRAAR